LNHFWKASHALRFALLMALAGLLALRAVWTAFREGNNRPGATHTVTLGVADYLNPREGALYLRSGGIPLLSPA
jgi:hypothetical protein